MLQCTLINLLTESVCACLVGAEQLGYSGAQWPSYAWPSASGVPYGVYTGSQTSLQAPVPGQYAMSPLPAFAPNTP